MRILETKIILNFKGTLWWPIAVNQKKKKNNKSKKQNKIKNKNKKKKKKKILFMKKPHKIIMAHKCKI